jgi:hypothetical protein
MRLKIMIYDKPLPRLEECDNYQYNDIFLTIYYKGKPNKHYGIHWIESVEEV